MADSIVEIIRDNAVKDPDRLCIVDADGEKTYAEVWNEARQKAQALSEAGVSRTDCVMVECSQKADYIISLFACNLIGAVFVAIENKAAQLRVTDIEKETDAKLFVHVSEYRTDCRQLCYKDLEARSGASEDIRLPRGEETAEILYTTGTTGKSKGIEITHANNIALAENICDGTKMKEGNVELIPLPISHSHGIRCCYANFFKSGTVILTDGVTRVKDIYNYIRDYRATAMDLSPAAASVLLRLTRGKLSAFGEQLDYIQIGTAALSEELKSELRSLFPEVRLYNFYGSTESGRSCALNFNSEEDRKYCIGRPTKNAKFIVTDEERHEIASSKERTGLLACAGAMNMKGYWKQPELTAKTMRDGYIFTNDEGYIDQDGFVYVLGRHDDIINYKGIKIAPEEIEEVVRKYVHVKDCACVPVADPVSGQVPKLFISVDNEDLFDKKEFADYLEKHIDGNKMPKKIQIIESIPRAMNGKIQRNKLMGGNVS